jgi:anti-sigma B factor antagonist
VTLQLPEVFKNLAVTIEKEKKQQGRDVSMTITELHPVSVKRLPEDLSERNMREFLLEIDSCVDLNRPRIVLDCSRLREIDGNAIHLLLHCLEEAMKRNGDVKLAALPAEGSGLLQMTGVSRLFDIFDTTAEAVNSFSHFPPPAVVPALVAQATQRGSERAA